MANDKRDDQPDLSIHRDDLDDVVAIAARLQAAARNTGDDTFEGSELDVITETTGLSREELARAKQLLERERKNRRKLVLGAVAIGALVVTVSSPMWWQKVFPPDHKALALESSQLTQRSSDLRKQKLYTMATQAAEKAVKKNPNNVEAWNMLGLSYQDREEYLLAREAYQSGIAVASIKPECANLYYNYASLLNKEPTTREEALKYFRMALECEPKHSEAFNNMAYTYEKMGQLTEAKKYYEAALKADPDNKIASNNLNDLLKRMGLVDKPAPKGASSLKASEIRNKMEHQYSTLKNYKEAIRLGLEGVREFPTDVQMWNELGLAYEKDDQQVEAAKAFTKAIQLGGNRHEACYPNYNMGRLVGPAGDHEGAVAYYKKAIALWPGYKWAHTNLGKEYEKLGRKKDAVAEFEAALAIDPYLTAAKEGLARVKGK